MNMMAAPAHGGPLCRRCGHPEPDLQLLGCSCLLHARCAPLSLVIADGSPYQYGGIPSPVKSSSLPCPICRTGTVVGIHLFPLAFSDLERAVDLRKQCAEAAAKVAEDNANVSTGKRNREDSFSDDSAFHMIQAESSYLLLSHTKAAGSHHQQNHRTGRWTSEEVSFVDQLVVAFDQGSLPLPHGVKLNEFLGDMLLCKSSRLTKKMKNAKLSTRSFTLSNIVRNLPDQYCQTLSMLQDSFLQSIPSEPLQLEIKFNMTKLWRTHFSNLCIQVGYELMDGRDWVASLEDMERRAADAEALMRRARRQRMGLALRQDMGEDAKEGVFVGGLPARRSSMDLSGLDPVTSGPFGPSQTEQASAGHPEPSLSPRKMSSASDDVVGPALHNSVESESDFFAHVLGGSPFTGPARPREMSDDFSIGIDDLVDPLYMVGHKEPPPNKLGDCGPFLDKVIHYIEDIDAPFEHVDVWVPSFLPSDDNFGENDSLRLYHAGHATRSDIDSEISFQMNEYGVYSTNFSFAPDVGLPGRVYSSGRPLWECKVFAADPTQFERAGGAKVYGVRTAVGIPLETPVVGRIILALYSTQDLPEDRPLLDRLIGQITKWTPEPKWKLVIELGQNEKSSDVRAAGSSVSFSANAGSSSVAVSSEVQSPPPVEDEELVIASLLGDHMPLTDTPGNPSMVQFFMSLRLLLLRSDERRTDEEKEMLEILKKSFRGYSKDNKRTDAELASLLAKDWMFLSAANAKPSPAPMSLQQHQCHVMPIRTRGSSIGGGGPTSLPSSFIPLGVTTQSSQSFGGLPQPQSMVSFSSNGSIGSGASSKFVSHHNFKAHPQSTGNDAEGREVSEGSREVSPTSVPDA